MMQFLSLVMAVLLCSCSSPLSATSSPYAQSATAAATASTAGSSTQKAHYIQLSDPNAKNHLKLMNEYCETSESPHTSCTDEYQVKPDDRHALVLKNVDARFVGTIRKRQKPTTDYITAENERGKYPQGYTANGERIPACFKYPEDRKCQMAVNEYKIRGPGFQMCLNPSFTEGSLIVERYASSGKRYYGKVVSADDC